MELALVSLALLLFNLSLGGIFTYFLLSTRRHQADGHSHRKKLEIFKKRAKLIFFNIFLLSLLTMFGLYFVSQYFSLTFSLGVGAFIFQLVCYLIFDDSWFYCWHRCLHKNKYLLRKVHRIHHQANEPVPLEFIYVHPVEWLGGTIGIVAACAFIYLVFGDINAYPFWLFTFFRSAHELLIHSTTKSRILRYVPLFHTNEAHALHHARACGNYASMFNYLDRICKTDLSRVD